MERFVIRAVTRDVAGVSPTLTVWHQQSDDEHGWTTKDAAPAINTALRLGETSEFW